MGKKYFSRTGIFGAAASVSLILIFQNCSLPPGGFETDMGSLSSLSGGVFQAMERPTLSRTKVGVFYTPYNKTMLGYPGSGRPEYYKGNNIHVLKDKPLYQWPGSGAVFYTESTWLNTFNIETTSLPNPLVPDLAQDKVLKYHAKWLHEMGADFIIWDSTNHAWAENGKSDEPMAMIRDPLIKLLDAWVELRAQGQPTPQLALWVPIPSEKIGTYLVYSLLEIIEKPKYKDLIFQYEGKPLLILVGSDHPLIMAQQPSQNYFRVPNPTIVNELKDRYTIREMWANELMDGNSNNWSYLQKCTSGGQELTPYVSDSECNQRISPNPTGSDRVEQIPVTFAFGRDHMSNRQSATGKRKGYTILRQLETVYKNAQQVDIVTVSWWNTWGVIKLEPVCISGDPLYRCETQGGQTFYSSGGNLVNPKNNGLTPGFTDDYDEEYSVTFEPAGVTGDYYMRLMNRGLKAIAANQNPMTVYDTRALTIQGELNSSMRDSTITGWACLRGSSNSILVSVRAGQTEVAQIRADKEIPTAQASAALAACDSSRTLHGFSYKLTSAQLSQFQGQTLTVTGLTESEYFPDAVLSGSVSLTMANTPNVIATPTPTPTVTPTPTPTPTVKTCDAIPKPATSVSVACPAGYTGSAQQTYSVTCNTATGTWNTQLVATNNANCSQVVSNNTKTIYRYRNTEQMGHVFRAESYAPGSQYVAEGARYQLYVEGGSGRIAIYRCQASGSTREFQSTSANCEGHTPLELLGYALNSPGQGSALYRCFHTAGGHLFTTYAQECSLSGYTTESILGYVPQ